MAHVRCCEVLLGGVASGAGPLPSSSGVHISFSRTRYTALVMFRKRMLGPEIRRARPFVCDSRRIRGGGDSNKLGAVI